MNDEQTGKQVVIGLDVGTTSIKAVAFDLGGREVAQAIYSTPTRHHTNGHADYDPQTLWHQSAKALRKLALELQERAIEPVALAVTSMAESGVLLDSGGNATYPIIPWFDYRTEPQIEWWNQIIGSDETAAICGVVPHPMFGMPKLLWLRDNEPEAFRAGRRWLNVADYIEYRLCGSMVTDYSLASRTLALDLVGLTWSTEILEAIGISPGLLADLVGAGSLIGELTRESAALTALPAALPIGRGGQDHVCAALATGITEPGMVLDSIGTAEAFFAVRDAPDMSGRLWPDELNQGVHVVDGQYYVMTGTGDGAGRIDQHRAELGVEFDEYLAAAESAGPEQAMIESLAVDGQALFEKMAAASGANVRHIATGGGTRIPLLMRRKREIGGRPIERPEIAEATCKGAAMLAAQAVGLKIS